MDIDCVLEHQDVASSDGSDVSRLISEILTSAETALEDAIRARKEKQAQDLAQYSYMV